MKLTQGALGNFKEQDLDVKLLLNQGFLQQCGDSVRIDDKNGLIAEYNPIEGEPPVKGIQHLNFASIAKVCDTEILTIETIIKEIGAQIRDHLKMGKSLRLTFKVGKLISRGGEIKWKSFREDNQRKVNDTESRYTSMSRHTKKSDIQSYTKSAMTPSIAKTRAASHNFSFDESRTFHMANPNPQNHN